MAENAVVELGELSKPATTLVEKISDAVGGIFKPYQTVRMAKAEAEADLIRAESEIKVTDLHRRAMNRFVEEEAKKQINMEAITEGALPLLADESNPEKLPNDWITNFFDKCRIVSDAEMQHVWARVLAREANGPGSFSRQTINLLGDLDKGDAELFSSLCRFMWGVGEMAPIIFDPTAEIYRNNGINFPKLLHLKSLGLIEMDTANKFFNTKLPKKLNVSYFGKVLQITFPADSDNSLNLGNALFTRAGTELARVCAPVAVPGFFEFVAKSWTNEGLQVSNKAGV